MNWIAAKVTFSGQGAELLFELIAEVFYILDIKGVVLDDPALRPEEAWGSDAVPPPVRPAVTGYLPDDERIEQRRLELERSMRSLAAAQGFDYAIAYVRVAEEDWAESWKAFFTPQAITARLVVKPTWCDYVPAKDQLLIEIDPGMAFGTGTHPTTALCLRLLEKHVRPGAAILDVGTGSGILLIAAAKLGAGRLTGVDLDPLAVEIARRNLRRNLIPEERITLSSGHLLGPISGTHDLVVANILAEVILDLLPGLPRVLSPGGVFICSGIIQASAAEVMQALHSRGYAVSERLDEDEWVALAARLGPGHPLRTENG